MSLSSLYQWIRWPRRRQAAQPRHAARRARRPLEVEYLEDRFLLSTGISEFPTLTAGSGPTGITLGPDGNVWVTERNVNQIAVMNVTGAMQEFKVPTANAGLGGITAGPDGAVWFAEANANQIGRISLSGTITEFLVPTAYAVVADITAGPDGNLWFTEAAGNNIGKITPAGVITEFPVGKLSPTEITAGPDGNLWFTPGNASGKVGRIAPSGTVTLFAVPSSKSDTVDITAGPDGNLWFTEFPTDKIGRINPSTGTVAEFSAPSASLPEGITTGPDGNLWFTEATANQIGQITPAGLISAQFTIPTKGSGPGLISLGPHGSVVFTEFNAGNIGLVHDVLDANQSFVQALYQDDLGRSGSPSEVNGWVSVLLSSGTAAVVNGIALSGEARTHLVKSFYLTYLGRPAVNGEEQGFVNALTQGATAEQVLEAILASPEYFQHAPQVAGVGGGAPSAQTLVKALYLQLLNRPGRASEINGWVSLLPALGQAGVAAAILASGEYRSDVVVADYSQIVHRIQPPSQGEVSFWVNSGLDSERILLGFELSQEFFFDG